MKRSSEWKLDVASMTGSDEFGTSESFIGAVAWHGESFNKFTGNGVAAAVAFISRNCCVSIEIDLNLLVMISLELPGTLISCEHHGVNLYINVPTFCLIIKLNQTLPIIATLDFAPNC